MNRYEKLLKSWCDSIVSHQLTAENLPHRGGILCDACTCIHGRADNAIFPLAYVYKMTGDKKYLDAIYLLMDFRNDVSAPDGSAYNDANNAWKATTTFSVIEFYKTLVQFRDDLPKDLTDRFEQAVKSGAEWIYENVVPGFYANINYYAASAASMAMCGKFFGDEKYTELAKTMLAYCMEHFTENGILLGEGHPHNGKSPRGCGPIDIGYDIEESVPCLVDAAETLGDIKTLKRLASYTAKFCDFILPDGGIDNTFGTRNNKWTYYGSRTSDGAVAALLTLSKYEPCLAEAALRTAEQYGKCTDDGMLYGGPHYKKLGQKPCIHHTFCHAAGLADALLLGLGDDIPRRNLPIDSTENTVKFYPELNTYKLGTKKWLATVTGYDYALNNRSAMHTSGGMVSMLYSREKGPVIMGSTYEYRLAEPLNMQLPMGSIRHSSLIMRLEYTENGVKYVTCLDPDSEISIGEDSGVITANVLSHFVNVLLKRPNRDVEVRLTYIFGDEVKIRISLSEPVDNVKFILPVVADSAEVISDREYEKEQIYYLSGGFSADEYKFDKADGLEVTIK